MPGIIEWPAVINENQKTEFPVVTSDLLPNVCDILGVDHPHRWDCHSTPSLERDIDKRQAHWVDVSRKQWRL